MPKKKIKKKLKKLKPIPERTYRGCPLTRNNDPHCYGYCVPEGEEKKGLCGRIAPHSMESRIQKGIREHRERKAKASGRKS